MISDSHGQRAVGQKQAPMGKVFSPLASSAGNRPYMASAEHLKENVPRSSWSEDGFPRGSNSSRHVGREGAKGDPIPHSSAVKEAQLAVAEAEKKGEKVAVMRKLIGPRAGLPTLRKDVLRLAALLHVEVCEKESVDQIKQKLRPIVNLLMGDIKKAPPSKAESPAIPKAQMPSASLLRIQGSPPCKNSGNPAELGRGSIASSQRRHQQCRHPRPSEGNLASARGALPKHVSAGSPSHLADGARPSADSTQ